jgi:histidyl-tRNA synthetase
MARPTPMSGFPEWLPHERLVEQHVVDTVREVFELHGFASIETRAVEPLDQLLRKGETDKEIYLLRRLQAEEGADSDAGLGLHFDLTVPFARYVMENSGKLDFPLRRYQIQKAWRGERPQEGRYREFLQADIDVVDRDTLPFHYEVELPLVIADALSRLPVPAIRMQVNNRRIPEGFYRGIGIPDPAPVLRAVDKLGKIGPDGVRRILVDSGCSEAQAEACLALADIRSEDGSFVDRVKALGVTDELLARGLEELDRVVEAGREHAPGLLVADLSIARGLDYYTGTVYETVMVGSEKLGSICSGGRYDALASDGETTYPGVGLSLGVTRLLSRLIGHDLAVASRSVPTCVLVALPDEESRPRCARIAAALRRRGISCHVAPEAAKYGKQIRFAERRGIPFVWFPGADGSDQVKDIRSGDQGEADADEWAPPETDLRPQITARAENEEKS